MYRSFYRVLVALAAVGLLVAVTATVAFAQGQGRVTGTVTDAAGLPLAGAVVKAENPNARPPVFEQKTGNNGRYAMIGLMSGPWTFTASYEGYRPNAGPVKVRAGENPPVNFSLERILHPLEIALGEEALKGLDPKAIEQELAGADAAFNAQQWDKAIAGYQAILQKLPALTNLNLNIGNAYRANGDNKSALASYEAVLKGDPGNEQAKTEIARTKLAMGDLSGAAELQKSAGVDIGTISRVETGKMTGTLESHMRLAHALGVKLTELYSGIEEAHARQAAAVQPASARTEVYVHETGKSSLTMLTADVLKKKLMPVLITIEPGGSTHREETRVGTEKFVYVLEGEVEAKLGEETHQLKRGASLYFDASTPHLLHNASAKPARCLAVTTPPAL